MKDFRNSCLSLHATANFSNQHERFDIACTLKSVFIFFYHSIPKQAMKFLTNSYVPWLMEGI